MRASISIVVLCITGISQVRAAFRDQRTLLLVRSHPDTRLSARDIDTINKIVPREPAGSDTASLSGQSSTSSAGARRQRYDPAFHGPHRSSSDPKTAQTLASAPKREAPKTHSSQTTSAPIPVAQQSDASASRRPQRQKPGSEPYSAAQQADRREKSQKQRQEYMNKHQHPPFAIKQFKEHLASELQANPAQGLSPSGTDTLAGTSPRDPSSTGTTPRTEPGTSPRPGYTAGSPAAGSSYTGRSDAPSWTSRSPRTPRTPGRQANDPSRSDAASWRAKG